MFAHGSCHHLLSWADATANASIMERPDLLGEPVPCHLDAIGVRHQSELSSLVWDSLRSWERFLAPRRDQAFDLLQIGVGTGASLRTWREWFPAARPASSTCWAAAVSIATKGSGIFRWSRAEKTNRTRGT